MWRMFRAPADLSEASHGHIQVNAKLLVSQTSHVLCVGINVVDGSQDYKLLLYDIME